MIEPREHINERARLRELESFSILDTLPEADYDDITAIAAELCGAHISLISLVDRERQWFKSHHGLDVTEAPKAYAFCAHAIHDHENVMVIQDSRKDERFHDNPFVTGEPSVIFYAGVPLVSDNNLPLGTLCVIDHEPKKLSQSQVHSLRALGNQVMNTLRLRKSKLILNKAYDALEQKNKELERFASIAAHDLKSPLLGISGLSNILTTDYGPQMDDEGKKMLQLLEKSSNKLGSLIEGLLAHSRSENLIKEKKSKITLKKLVQDLTGLFI